MNLELVPCAPETQARQTFGLDLKRCHRRSVVVFVCRFPKEAKVFKEAITQQDLAKGLFPDSLTLFGLVIVNVSSTNKVMVMSVVQI